MRERARRLQGVWGLAYLLGRAAKDQLDAPDPKIVFVSKKTIALYEFARELAEAGREDPAAVQQLLQAAGRKPKDLLRAAARIRQNGWQNESIEEARAERLLRAAAAGRDVEPLSPQEIERLQQIAGLEDQPLEVSFAKLEKLEPALAAFAQTVREEGAVPAVLVPKNAPDFMADYPLEAALESLVGPEARATDPIVRSQAAYTVAVLYLRSALAKTDDDR